MSIKLDNRVQKSLRRLQAMGLKAHIEVEGKDRGYIFIDLNSLLNMIYRKITYPNRKVYFEYPFIVVEIWRSTP